MGEKAMQPAISVIMPVFNGARFVERAIDSVLDQTFAAWELLVTDDGSTDNSTAIIHRCSLHADQRIRLLTQSNRGISAARNTALREARGELVAYLDCDDEFYPDHLANVWRNRERADCLLFSYDVLDERSGEASIHDTASKLEFVSTYGVCVPLGIVHHRALLDRVGLFNESFGIHKGTITEDADLQMRFARAGASFAAIPGRSGLYHLRADSISRNYPDPPEIHEINLGPKRIPL